MSSWPDKPRILMSYAYLADKYPQELAGCDVLIDSGAFTAHSLGKEIKLDNYINFLGEHEGKYTAAFALDVIGNHTESMKAWKIISRQLPRQTIIPTWHIGSDFSLFEEMCDLTGYVSIGGAVPYSNRPGALMRQFIKCHKIAQRKGVKVHGLGVSSNSAAQLPWYSTDSSSWLYVRQYPMLLLANRSGRIESISRGQPNIKKRESLLRRYGIPLGAVLPPDATKPASVGKEVSTRRLNKFQEASARSYMFTEDKSPHDTHVYCVAGAPVDVSVLKNAWAIGSPY